MCGLRIIQLIKHDNLRLSFMIYNSKVNIFGFWTVGQIKQYLNTSGVGNYNISLHII